MDIVEQLRGGDRRSIGRVAAVVEAILAEPRLFAALFEALTHDDPVVRMRAADAAEKVSGRRPELLLPYKDRLLGDVARIPQQEVRWHVAQMLPRLPLSAAERGAAVALLTGYLQDSSAIVRTCALQGLADLAQDDQRLRERLVVLLQDLTRTGSPAMKSRGRMFLTALGEAAPVDGAGS